MAKNEVMLRCTMMESADNESAEIMVYGAITDWKYRDEDPDITAREFDKMLKDAKVNGAKKLKLRINSGGGMVYQAVAMRSMLLMSDFEAIDVSIEGLCASAATLLCCLPNSHVTIAQGSEFMIHNPSTIAIGTANDFVKVADRLSKMESDFHTIYADRSGKSKDEIKDMMDAETWMTAREAVDNGFCDEVVENSAIAAYTDSDIMLLKNMYSHMPEDIAVKRNEEQEDSNATAEDAADASVYNNTQEDSTMEIKDLTMEQLQTENPALYDSVMEAGAAAERERISEIDDLTPAGYEKMATEAKANGTSAMDFCKMLVKAQREKGKAFIENRIAETEPAGNVSGGAAEDTITNAAEEEDKAAKDIAEFANSMRVGGDTMY